MRKDAIKGMKTKIENFIRGGYHEDKKGADQAFLWGLIWPIAMNENLTHDPFFTENAPFPTPERDAEGLVYFIGEAVREDDTLWSQADRDALDRRENAG